MDKIMKTTYKYISFEKGSCSGITERWIIRNRESYDFLGEIKWASCWRQYCLFTCSDIVFSSGCLEDIRDFIKQLMDERKR